jgi:hypothetical protein
LCKKKEVLACLFAKENNPQTGKKDELLEHCLEWEVMGSRPQLEELTLRAWTVHLEVARKGVWAQQMGGNMSQAVWTLFSCWFSNIFLFLLSQFKNLNFI